MFPGISCLYADTEGYKWLNDIPSYLEYTGFIVEMAFVINADVMIWKWAAYLENLYPF